MSLKNSNLLDFYYNDLYPELLALEKERKRIVKKLAVFTFILVAISLFVAVFFLDSDFDSLIDISIGAFFILSIFTAWIMKDYKRRFKQNIFAKLVAKIDPTLEYNPSSVIPKALFQSSRLFNSRIDFYGGNDFIKGEIDGVPIEFSDVIVQKEYRDSKGRKHRSTIFAGTFVVTEFHKHFRKSVLVYPDTAEKYLGVIGSWLQGVGSSKLVRMDSPAFEKEFKVVADDPIEAHYLLTPNIMEKLVELKKSSGSDIYLSFRLNKLFIAISNGGDWFEPTLFKSLLSIDIFKSYIENLNLILGIVKELNLNRKIWSKE